MLTLLIIPFTIRHDFGPQNPSKLHFQGSCDSPFTSGNTFSTDDDKLKMFFSQVSNFYFLSFLFLVQNESNWLSSDEDKRQNSIHH